MQTDPIGYADQMNLYAYVYNDPMNFTDPYGLSGEGCGDRPNCQEFTQIIPDLGAPDVNLTGAAAQNAHQNMVNAQDSGRGLSSSVPGRSADGGGYKACMEPCLRTNYGETYEWAERVSPVSLQGLLTNEAIEVIQEKGMKEANRNAWSEDHNRFKRGTRQLGFLKFFSRFNAGMAVAGSGAVGFQVGAIGYCSVECIGGE